MNIKTDRIENRWVSSLEAKPPFKNYLLFQTKEDLIFYGFRNNGIYYGVCATHEKILTAEVEEVDVIQWFMAEDPTESIRKGISALSKN